MVQFDGSYLAKWAIDQIALIAGYGSYFWFKGHLRKLAAKYNENMQAYSSHV